MVSLNSGNIGSQIPEMVARFERNIQNKPYSRSSFYKHLKKEVNHLNFSKPEPVNFLPVICSQSKDITSDTISVNGYELSFSKDADEKILKKLLGALKDL